MLVGIDTILKHGQKRFAEPVQTEHITAIRPIGQDVRDSGLLPESVNTVIDLKDPKSGSEKHMFLETSLPEVLQPKDVTTYTSSNANIIRANRDKIRLDNPLSAPELWERLAAAAPKIIVRLNLVG